MPRHVNHIVHTAHHPEITIFVSARPVSSEVNVFAINRRNMFPIGFAEPVVIAINRAHHSRPRMTNCQIAAFSRRYTIAVHINDISQNARERKGCRTGFRGDRSRQWCNHDPACFGLPPSIHNRATLRPNHLVIPHPSFWINRFTDSPKQPERS